MIAGTMVKSYSSTLQNCEKCELYKMDLEVYETLAMSLDFAAKTMWQTGLVPECGRELRAVSKTRKWVAQLAARDIQPKDLQAYLENLD